MLLILPEQLADRFLVVRSPLYYVSLLELNTAYAAEMERLYAPVHAPLSLLLIASDCRRDGAPLCAGTRHRVPRGLPRGVPIGSPFRLPLTGHRPSAHPWQVRHRGNASLGEPVRDAFGPLLRFLVRPRPKIRSEAARFVEALLMKARRKAERRAANAANGTTANGVTVSAGGAVPQVYFHPSRPGEAAADAGVSGRPRLIGIHIRAQVNTY